MTKGLLLQTSVVRISNRISFDGVKTVVSRPTGCFGEFVAYSCVKLKLMNPVKGGVIGVSR